MNSIFYSSNSEFSETDLIELAKLYTQAQWISTDDSIDFLRPAIKGSFAVVSAWHESKIIGFGRVISDGFSDAYIQDVVVDGNYRRRGIGSEIIRRLVEILRQQGIDWIGLVGEPGTEKFYTGLGFKKYPDYSFMRHENNSCCSRIN